MAVVGTRRRSGTGSVYRLHNGSWQGALRGPGRLRRYVSGPTRDAVERKLEQLRRADPPRPSSRGRRSEIRARNVLKIIELALIRAQMEGWSKKRTAEVLAA